MKNIFPLFFLLLISGIAYAQQWSGVNNTSAHIGRTGNVGIGTTTPSTKLSFGTGVQARMISLYDYSTDWYGLGISPATMRFQVGSILAKFSFFGGESHEAFTIMGNGKIGIGATEPSQKLEVAGNILQNAENSAFGIDAQANARFGVIKKFGNYPMIVSDNTSPIIFGQTNQNGIYTNITNATLTERMRIDVNGNVGIGTNNPGSFKLAVEGKIGAREVEVRLSGPWPDYVFVPEYELPSLQEVEAFIKVNRHLQGVPSAKEVENNGHNLGEMDAVLLKKIEELTLYLIDQNKRLSNLEAENQQLKEMIKK